MDLKFLEKEDANVEKVDKRVVFRYFIISIQILFISLPIFFAVFVRTLVIKQGYKLMQITQTLRDLEDKKSSLYAEYLMKTNPKNIQEFAKKMGFQLPSKDRIIIKR